MRLREWQWNEQRYAEVEYPDEPIKAFIDWLRNTRQWYQGPDPGRDVYTRFRKLESELAEYRADPERLKRERLKAQMAKARAAKKAKREAALT